MSQEKPNRGRRSGDSRGPKLQFQNKLECKSRSKCRRKFSTANKNEKYSNKTSVLQTPRIEFQRLNTEHQPKIAGVDTSNSDMFSSTKKLNLSKPPLVRPAVNQVNIERVR